MTITNDHIEKFLDQLDGMGIKISLRNTKLEVKSPKGTFNQDLKHKFSKNQDQIRAFLQEKADPISILPEKIESVAPLSPWQQGFWMMHIRPDSDKAILHLPIILTINGLIDYSRLKKAFKALCQRHEILRLRIKPSSKGIPEQFISDDTPSLDILEPSVSNDEVDFDDFANSSLQSMIFTSMDLSNDAPVKIKLISKSNNDHRLLIVAHHVAVDGWSLGIMINELIQIYENNKVHLPATKSFIATSQYYANHWQKPRQSVLIDKIAETISEYPICQSLATDYKRGNPAEQSNDSISFQVNPKEHQNLCRFAHSVNGDLQAVLLSSLQILYWQLTGEKRLTTMVPVSNRAKSVHLETMMGCMANAIIPSVKITKNLTIKGALTNTVKEIQKLLEFQDVPFDEIITKSNHPRLTGTYPVAQIVLALQDAASIPCLPSLDIQVSSLPIINRQDLFIEFRYGPDNSLNGHLHFDDRLFDRDTANALAYAYQNILRQVSKATPDQLLTSLNLGKSRFHPKKDEIRDEQQKLTVKDDLTLILARRISAATSPDECIIWHGPTGLERLQVQRAADLAGVSVLTLPLKVSDDLAEKILHQNKAKILITHSDLHQNISASQIDPNWANNLTHLSHEQADLPKVTRVPQRLLYGQEGLKSVDTNENRKRDEAAIHLLKELDLPTKAIVGLDLSNVSCEIIYLLEQLICHGFILTEKIWEHEHIDLLLTGNSGLNVSAQKINATKTIYVNHLVDNTPAILGNENDGLILFLPSFSNTKKAFNKAIPLRSDITVVNANGTDLPPELPGFLFCKNQSWTSNIIARPVAKYDNNNNLYIRTDTQAANACWINGRYLDFALAGQQILSTGQFSDAALGLVEYDNSRKLVAYISEAGPSNFQVTEQFVRTNLAPYISIHYVTRLSSLPRTIDGHLDRHHLSLAPITSPDILSPIQLDKNTHVTTSPRKIPTPKLHLKDLLPPKDISNIKALPSYNSTDSNTTTSIPNSSEAPAYLKGPIVKENYPSKGWNPIEWIEQANNKTQTLYCIDHDGYKSEYCFSDLSIRARHIASGFQKQGFAKGDVIILACRRPADFLASFFGALLVGITVAPVPHPRLWKAGDSGFERLIHIGHLSQAKALIVNETISLDSNETPLKIIQTSTLEQSTESPIQYNWKADDEILISFTSGSTGKPKGVPLSAENIWMQPRSFGSALGFKTGETALNFTSLDHVASLIGFCCSALQMGCNLALISIDRFIAYPQDVVTSLETWKIARTWAPDFSWNIITKILNDTSPGELDLSALRALYSAGECPLEATYTQLQAGLIKHDAGSVALRTSWGMAETTSLMTLSDAWNSSVSHENSNGVIDSGTVIPGTEARIVNHNGDILKEGEIGLFEVRGRQIFKQYIILDAQEKITTKVPFNQDGWMETGDLAYFINGRIVLLGRDKDVLILKGQNIAQAAIEDTINRINGVESGFSAVISSRNSHTGELCLIIFFCLKNSYCSDDEIAEIVHAISNKIVAEYGVTPTNILPVTHEIIAKTGLGKIQRPKLRNAFEQGKSDQNIKRMDLLLNNEFSINSHFCEWQDATISLPILPSSLAPTIILLDDQQGSARAIEKTLTAMGKACYRIGSLDQLQAQQPETLYHGVYQLVVFDQISSANKHTAINLMKRVEIARQFEKLSNAPCRIYWIERDEYSFMLGKSLSASLSHEIKNINSHSIYTKSLLGQKDLSNLARILHSNLSAHHFGITLHPNGHITTAQLKPINVAQEIQWTNLPVDATIVIAGGTGAIGRLLIKQLLLWTNWKFICLGRRTKEEISPTLGRIYEANNEQDRLSYIQVDISDAEALKSKLDTQSINAVINLTGQVYRTPFDNLDAKGLHHLVDQRLAAASALDQAFSLSSIRIAHITSTTANFGPHDFLGYSLSVAAHQQWIRSKQGQKGPVHIDLVSGQWQAESGATDVNNYLEKRGFPLVDQRSGAIAVIRALTGDKYSITVGLDCQGTDTAPYAKAVVPIDTLTIKSSNLDPNGTLANELRNQAKIYHSFIEIQNSSDNEISLALDNTEQKIMSLWRTLLPQSAQITPDSNFFDIGGSSLLTAQLQQGLKDLFGGPEDILTLFSHTSIRSQAKLFSKSTMQAPKLNTLEKGNQNKNSNPVKTRNSMAIRRKNARRKPLSQETLT